MDGLKSIIGTSSIWKWEQWRPDSKGSGTLILHDAWEETNITTDEGISHALDVVFSNGVQKIDWYTGVFNDDYTPVETDTYQSPGFIESVNYDEVSRPIWQEAGVIAKSLTNAANRVSFTMNAAETIYGGALFSASTKGDAASGEILYCASKFSASKDVEVSDVLKVTVVIAGQDL